MTESQQEESGKGQRHLLDLPLEVRSAIWNQMLEEINKKRAVDWFAQPPVEFASLSQTCKQLCDEITDYKPQHLVPFAKLRQFAGALAGDWRQQTPAALQKYKSLTIQFKLNADATAFKLLRQILYTCCDHLEELHLSFTGKDAYDTRAYLHGCAYAPKSKSQTRLHPEGQRHRYMLKLVPAIVQLTKLRILVISNANYPMYHALIQHKPRLEYFHLTADPRSAIHLGVSASGIGSLIIAPSGGYPPLKVLQLSANASINAIALPSHSARTLEHLTWTIPDASSGSDLIGVDYFSMTRQLVQNLDLNAVGLTTLRICVQGSGLAGNPHGYGNLEWALTGGVTRLRSLRDFEVHFRSNDSNFGWAILDALPDSLERFYTNDLLVKPQELNNFVTAKYLSATLNPQRPPPLDYEEARLARWSPKTPMQPPQNDYWPEDTVEEEVTMWIHPTTYEPIYWDKNEPPVGDEVRRECMTKGFEALFLPGIIGEDRRRKDYIPLHTGNLKFVAYEFRNPEYTCRTGGTEETLTQMVLRLNGRLLDRARNAHIGAYAPGSYIPPRLKHYPSNDDESETQSRSSSIQYSTLLYQLHEAEASDPRPSNTFVKELNACGMFNDHWYFSTENEAKAVFEREAVALAEDLPPLTYPYFVDCEQTHQCHWMCPEADVPTLTQIDKMEAERRG